ncbi:MAG: iron-sulfur cluster assembly scaffold protein [Sphingobium sp.]
MSSALYSRDILRLAASIPHHRRLDHPDASADRRSPTCGSRVIADVCMDGDGRLSSLGLDVRACALGQASASLMAAHAIGRSAEDMRRASEQLRRWLSDAPSGGEAEADFWPGMAVFAAARAYPARHPSILLSFEAVAEAAAATAAASRKEGQGTGMKESRA